MITQDINIMNATILNNPTLRWNTDYFAMEFYVPFELESGDFCMWSCFTNEQNLEKLKKLFEFATTATSLEGRKIRIAGFRSLVGFGHPTEDRFVLIGSSSSCEELTFAQLCDNINKSA